MSVACCSVRGGEVDDILGLVMSFIGDHPVVTTISAIAATGFAGTGIFSFLRRVRPEDEKPGQYFTDIKLLKPPMDRPAYSDRMAYVLAEMSDLAYYQFEGAGGFIADAAENAVKLKLDKAEDIRDFLDKFSTELLGSRDLGLQFLEELLAKSDFELIQTINIKETQGIACKRVARNEPPYVVIAFRGTENKVSDWLTDADAVPTVVGNTKVHTGFLKAFTQYHAGVDDRTVEAVVRDIVEGDAAKDSDGKRLPIFITGHSLGGALALMATRLVACDVNGACYTFGAPRIANYEYFEDMKTPVFRIVNSSDIVPRVPPGAAMVLLTGLARLLSWATQMSPGVSTLFDRLEGWLDKLNGYRHYGDLRYLTDVATGRSDDVRLLPNPPAADRAIWMWRHLAASLFVPLKSHSMSIYRKKLQHVANERNTSD